MENERQTLGKFSVLLYHVLRIFFVSFCLGFFFSSRTRNNLMLHVLRCDQPVFFLLQPQICLEQHILANLINRAWALLNKQDGGSVSAGKHLLFFLASFV